jgi:hypothetical protein
MLRMTRKSRLRPVNLSVALSGRDSFCMARSFTYFRGAASSLLQSPVSSMMLTSLNSPSCTPGSSASCSRSCRLRLDGKNVTPYQTSNGSREAAHSASEHGTPPIAMGFASLAKWVFSRPLGATRYHLNCRMPSSRNDPGRVARNIFQEMSTFRVEWNGSALFEHADMPLSTEFK